jgi:hypothetical protein
MEPRTTKPPAGTKVTPLWIVAAFVTLTETILGFAVTQVIGGVQVALTVFVISFALLVAGAFFLILWNRPWVFYPPSEYADVNPKDFMSALREAPGVVEQIKLARTVDENPLNSEARFELIDSMADDAQCQWLILMHEKELEITKWAQHVYEHNSGAGGMGAFSSGTRQSLERTGLVGQAAGGRYLRLTEEGHKFAEWLTKKGRKCDFFWSEYGGWGTPKPNSFADRQMREMQAKKIKDQEAQQVETQQPQLAALSSTSPVS